MVNEDFERWNLASNGTEVSEYCFDDRIRIQILFGFTEMTKHKYEEYSASQKWPNTNIIWLPRNDRIQIRMLFGFPEMTEYEYEYYLVFQKWPNTNIIRLPNNDQLWITFSFIKNDRILQEQISLSLRPVLRLTKWC